MLISEEYRQLNAALHRDVKLYGSSGCRDADLIKRMIELYQAETVLDYGCGKGRLAEALNCRGYDPAVPKFCLPPEPVDFVVCHDVMEHVEEDCVSDVLDHIASLAKKAAFFTICVRPSRKILSDGRNSHITLRPIDWWLEELKKHFLVVVPVLIEEGEQVTAVCGPLECC